jgi:L-cystine uptake protein TcyP (sodium:dicarboxylate symporter family)
MSAYQLMQFSGYATTTNTISNWLAPLARLYPALMQMVVVALLLIPIHFDG